MKNIINFAIVIIISLIVYLTISKNTENFSYDLFPYQYTPPFYWYYDSIQKDYSPLKSPVEIDMPFAGKDGGVSYYDPYNHNVYNYE